MILYLIKPWLQVNKKGWKFVIYDSEEKSERITPIWLIDAIVVFSRIQLTTDVLNACIREKISVFFIVWNWKYLWKLDSLEPKNVELLYKHIWCALNDVCSLKYSKVFIKSKIHNSKIMLKRWAKWSWKPVDIDDIVEKLSLFLKEVENTENLDELRWYEWNASRVYYQGFARFLPAWYIWAGRNKRPPRDEVNALLSLWYTLLAQTIHMYIEILWLDPQIWFMHQPKEVENTENLDELRWYEWNASRVYYQGFARFLPAWYIWAGRNKRPPRDEVNALLSLWYTLLAQTIHMYIEILWLDPQIWFMHQPKDLRSLLVLDMMEMFRAWIVDDLVLKVLRNNLIGKDDFIIDRHSQTPVLLTEDGLRKFISKYYQEVFKKSVEDNVLDGTKWVKLQYVEKTLEEFKKSLIDEGFEYKGFRLK